MTVRHVVQGGRAAPRLLVRGARAVDPLAGLDQVVDVLLRKGRIVEMGDRGSTLPPGCAVVEAEGCAPAARPGRSAHPPADSRPRGRGGPGPEPRRPPARGGFVTIFGMANTDPVVDSAPIRRGSLAPGGRRGGGRAAHRLLCRHEPRPRRPGQLAEMHDSPRPAPSASADDGVPVGHSYKLLRRALQDHAKVTDRYGRRPRPGQAFADGRRGHARGRRVGQAGPGRHPPPSPRAPTWRVPSRWARYETGRLHLCHVSTSLALEHLARARDLDLPVSAEATPHHLTLTDERLTSLDPNLKMKPRRCGPEADRRALVEALKSSPCIDCVATESRTPRSAREGSPFRGGAVWHNGSRTAFAALYTGLVLSGGAATCRAGHAHEPGAGAPRRTARRRRSPWAARPTSAWSIR